MGYWAIVEGLNLLWESDLPHPWPACIWTMEARPWSPNPVDCVYIQGFVPSGTQGPPPLVESPMVETWIPILALTIYFLGIYSLSATSVKCQWDLALKNSLLCFVQVEAISNSRPLIYQMTMEFLSWHLYTSWLEGHLCLYLILEHLTRLSLSSSDGIFKIYCAISESDGPKSTRGWKLPFRNVTVGDVIVLQECGMVPTEWPLWRVVETYPRKDSLVRVVSVKTSCGMYRQLVPRLTIMSLISCSDSYVAMIFIRYVLAGGITLIRFIMLSNCLNKIKMLMLSFLAGSFSTI